MKKHFTLLLIFMFCYLTQAQSGCWNKVYAGRAHSIFLKDDGSAWVAGLNINGQLGIGTNTNVNQLTNLNISGFTKFALGDYHTLAIKTDGTLWAWGSNTFGQLGDGTTIDKNIPVQIGTDTNWVEVTTGRQHSTALKSNGTLWAWGFNGNSNLGDGTSNNSLVPIQIGTANNWSKIASGYYHTLAIKTNGSLWAWGSNDLGGALGDGTIISKNFPIQVGTATNWSKIAGGNVHSVAVKTDGTLWAWGGNTVGQVGNGNTTDVLTPTQIGTANNWTDVSAGLAHTIALQSNGSIWTCGLNNTGQTGSASININPNPILNAVSTTNSIISISAGAHHNNLIDNQNNLVSFGSNLSGQFGNGNNTGNNIPLNYISCQNLSVINQHINPKIVLFPNPASEFILLEGPESTMASFSYQIFDMAGKIVKSGTAKFGEQINIQNLINEFYIMKGATENGEIVVKKFVKN